MSLLEHLRGCRTALLVTMVLLVLGASFVVAIRPSHALADATPTGIVIPLYNRPDSTWNTVINARALYPNVPIIVVANPNNGPGSSADPAFVQGIKSLQAAGVTVLGYVDMLNRPLSGTENQVSQWKTFYAVDGIMFDDMGNTGGQGNAYYSTVDAYAKSLGFGMTFGNPGTSVLPGTIGVFDVLCVYESSSYPSLAFITYPGVAKSNFGFIAYGVGLNSAFVTSSFPLVAWEYIDNLGGGNPYYTLSSLFMQNVALLSALDPPVGTTTTSSTTTTSIDPPPSVTVTVTTTMANSTATFNQTITSTVTATTTTVTSTAYSNGFVYGPNFATLTLRAFDLLGSQVAGMNMNVTLGADQFWGFSPYSLTLPVGVPVTICASNFGTKLFDHWANGSTSPCQSFSLTGNKGVGAYYSG